MVGCRYSNLPIYRNCNRQHFDLVEVVKHLLHMEDFHGLTFIQSSRSLQINNLILATRRPNCAKWRHCTPPAQPTRQYWLALTEMKRRIRRGEHVWLHAGHSSLVFERPNCGGMTFGHVLFWVALKPLHCLRVVNTCAFLDSRSVVN